MSRKSKIDPALKVELVERYWRDAFCDIVYIFCSENDIMMQGKEYRKCAYEYDKLQLFFFCHW